MKILIVIFSFMVFINACDNNGSVDKGEIGYGEIADGVYKNDYFKLSIDIPKGWAVQSEAEQQRQMKEGAEILSGDNDSLKKVIKASEKKTVNLFSFFKYEVGAPVPFNPSIISVAENVAAVPGVKNGSDYLYHVRKIFEMGQVDYQFLNEKFTEEISGVTFDVLPVTANTINLVINQDYYAAKLDDYVLSFILSYSNEEELNELKKIVSTISIN